VPPTMPLNAEARTQKTTRVATHQATNPCSRATLPWAVPQRRPATRPPKNEAMIAATIHQIAAARENVAAPGFPAAFETSNEASPTPTPRMSSTAWITRAAAAPAKIAPHAARLSR